MTRKGFSRMLFFAYLYAFGGLCVIAAAMGHDWAKIAVLVGAVSIPIVAWRSVRDWQESQLRRAQEAAQRERELRFRAIADGMAAGLVLTDLDGKIVQTNGAFQSMLGFEESELLGQSIDEYTLRTDVDLDDELMKELVDGEREAYQVEKRYVRRDEEILWGQVTFSLVRDAQDRPKYIAGMVQDVTSHKTEGSGLREIEQLFRQTFDQAAIGVAHTDADGRLMFVNRRLCDMLGYKREDLFGRKLRVVLHPDDVEAAERTLQQLRANELQEHAAEARFNRKNGGSLWANVTMSMMRQESGAPKYGIVMVEDVTERKKAQQALEQSEERYRAITETASDAILTLDDRSRVLFANRATRAIFGYSDGELVGKPLSTLLSERLQGTPLADIRHHLELAKHGRHGATTEVTGRHHDGHDLHLEIAVAPSVDGDKPTFTAVIRDITDRKAAEEQRARLIAREEEARAMSEAAAVIRNVVEASPLPIITLTPAGAVQSWNAAATRTFGWNERDVTGRAIPFETNADEAHELRQRALAGESVTGLEIRRQTRNGSWLDLSVSVAPVRDQHSRITGLMVVYDNITARKRAERELEQARDQALESSRLKSEFLATMSHEIRTPMNGIIGTMELLEDTELDTEQTEYVGVVSQSAQALLAIINDILDFSKLEADKLVLDAADFDLTNVVEGAADLLAAPAREKGLSLMTYVDPAIPAGLRGDPHRLRQILLNLIGNGLKFTERGGVVVHASREREEQDAVLVRFSVVDTGIGLSEAARNRLFQPFVQADGSTTRKYGGTGLGLAICKRLAESMGGSIGVDSEEGDGSTFWFTARFAVTSRSVVATARPELRGLHVLIADPSSSNRSILRGMTESWGMVCSEVSSAHEALHRLELSGSAPFDLVITEFRLPDADGLELARSIRNDESVKDTALIMLTAFDERGRGEEAVAAGFAAYLTKPCKRSQLLDAVIGAVGRAPEQTVDDSEPRIIEMPGIQPDSQAAVEPAPAEDATWYVPTPAPSVPAASSPVPAPATTPAPETPETNEYVAPGDRSLILLVEDNPINQLMALRQLEKLGHNVQIVSNGVQAVKVLTIPNRYDLVFMDCQMPEMDGYDATRAVRAAEVKSGRHIPIVAMTANAMAGDREACIAAGMDDYIAKPVNREMFREALRKWLPAREPENAAALVG